MAHGSPQGSFVLNDFIKKLLTKKHPQCILCITESNTKHTNNTEITNGIPQLQKMPGQKGENTMPDIKTMLPFLIPLIVAEFALLGFTLWHILTHKTYKRGNRTLWLIVAILGMEFIGPILYFILGKEDS